MPVGISVVILADDLIWSTRLARLVAEAGVTPRVVRDGPSFRTSLAGAGPVIVDLTARGYDPVAAIAEASAAGHRVLAVGQHDAAEDRRRARTAGADRVLAYRAIADAGPDVIGRWLAGDAVPA